MHARYSGRSLALARAVAPHAVDEREHGTLVPTDELPERGLVSLLRPRHHLPVAGGLQVAGPIFRAYDAVSCRRSPAPFGRRGEAELRAPPVHRHRAALRLPEPLAEPERRPRLAPRGGRAARLGS